MDDVLRVIGQSQSVDVGAHLGEFLGVAGK